MNKRSKAALDAIYDALFEMLLTIPFDEITVRGICKVSKVNKMTFYKYHEDKFDALSKAFRHRFEVDFSKQLGPEDTLFRDRDFEAMTYQTNRHVFLWCKRYAVQIRNIYTSVNQLAYDVVKTTLYEHYFAYMNAAIDFARLGLNPSLVTTFLFGGFIAVMEDYLRALRNVGDTQAVEKENDDFCRNFAHLMAVTFFYPEEGAAVLNK